MSGVFTKECFKRWVDTRQSKLVAPEESYRRALTAHCKFFSQMLWMMLMIVCELYRPRVRWEKTVRAGCRSGNPQGIFHFQLKILVKTLKITWKTCIIVVFSVI